MAEQSSITITSTKPILKGALDGAVITEDRIQSRHYHLLAGDLRNMESLGEKILSSGVSTR